MRWLSIDPGETTGWALWDDDELIEAGQMPMWQFIDDLGASVDTCPGRIYDPDFEPLFEGVRKLVIEDFVLYPEGIGPGPPPPWDKVRTARMIGALELIARNAGLEVEFQGAIIKDTAEKAGAEQLFLSPLHENRHANDAIRHGVYHLAMQGVRLDKRG